MRDNDALFVLGKALRDFLPNVAFIFAGTYLLCIIGHAYNIIGKIGFFALLIIIVIDAVRVAMILSSNIIMFGGSIAARFIKGRCLETGKATLLVWASTIVQIIEFGVWAFATYFIFRTFF